jgi:hypothetical protein
MNDMTHLTMFEPSRWLVAREGAMQTAGNVDAESGAEGTCTRSMRGGISGVGEEAKSGRVLVTGGDP